MAFLLTYHQKINHRGKKLLHSCIGASQLQEIRTEEGNKESWTFGQRSNYIFICNRLCIKSVPANCKFLESDIWGCICKIKKNKKVKRGREKNLWHIETNPSVSLLHIPEWRWCLSFSAGPVWLQMQFPATVLQAFYFAHLHVKAGNQSQGGCSWAPTCGATAPWVKRSGFPLLTLQWWRLGGLPHNAPGTHCMQGNRSSGLGKQMLGSQKTQPPAALAHSYLCFSCSLRFLLSFCLPFPLFLSFCDVKKVIPFYSASDPWK